MITVGKLELGNVLICDEVRQERNGKFILLGVFAGDILVSTIPASVPLSFYIELNVPSPGHHALSLRFSGPGEHSATLKVNLEAAEAGPGGINGPRMEVAMTQEGELRVDASTDDENWVNLVSKRVRLDPNASPPLFEQSPPDVQETSSSPEPSRRAAPKKRRRS